MPPGPRVGRQTDLPWKQVFIEEVTVDGLALCIDHLGHHINIPVSVTRAKGLRPAVGDSWIIDRAIGGRWSFAACINKVTPEITGSRDGNAALTSLLSMLASAGVIIDNTTP